MNIIKPTSDMQRHKFLNVARKYIRDCMKSEESLPFACLAKPLETLPEEFDATMRLYRQANYSWRKMAKKRLELTDELSQCSRDFYGNMLRRTNRLKHDHALPDLFKMPSPGNLPRTNDVDAWESIARDLIEGDMMAIEAGFPAMANPDVAELEAHLARVDEASMAVHTTHATRMAQQKRLNELRTEADEIHRQLRLYLRGWLIKETPSRTREIMRKFGYLFQSSDSSEEEQPEIEDQTPETPVETVVMAEPETTDPQSLGSSPTEVTAAAPEKSEPLPEIRKAS